MSQPLMNNSNIPDEDFWRLNRDIIDDAIVKRHEHQVEALEAVIKEHREVLQNIQNMWVAWATPLELPAIDEEDFKIVVDSTFDMVNEVLKRDLYL